jgi:XTP/dITP diphosphohydrolase
MIASPNPPGTPPSHQWLIATRNAHKVAEIQAILGSQVLCMSLKSFPEAPEVAEDAKTFAGNATKKAVAIARWLARVGTPAAPPPQYVLADDSGLEVDTLAGAPGVHSARFAALDPPGAPGNSPDAANNAKLLRLLEHVPMERRTARFRCVLALAPILPSATTNASPTCALDEVEASVQLFEGACEGRIGFAPRGSGGFGYDPLFTPQGFELSFAELGEAVKNGISHRARALAALKASLGRF